MAKIDYFLHTPRANGTIAMVVHRLPSPEWVEEPTGARYQDEQPMLMAAARLIVDHDEDARYHRWEISAHSEWWDAIWVLDRIGGSVYATKLHIASRRNYTLEIVPELDLIQPASSLLGVK